MSIITKVSSLYLSPMIPFDTKIYHVVSSHDSKDFCRKLTLNRITKKLSDINKYKYKEGDVLLLMRLFGH